MKTLQQLKKSNESVATYQPKPAGEKRFIQKHFDAENRPKMAPGFENGKDRAGNGDEVYRGFVSKVYERPAHGYAAAPSQEDEKVYEGKTWRRDAQNKRKEGGTVKKFLAKKKQRDEKRLQEMIEIPEDEEIVELVDDVNEAADATDVRALKGTVALRQYIGIVGTSPDQEHYVVQDQAGRRHHIFTSKELGDKGDKIDVHVKEYKSGAGLLSVAKKNVVKEETDLSEVSDRAFSRSVRNDPNHAKNAPQHVTAHDAYMERHHAIHKLLGEIKDGIDLHHKNATKKVTDLYRKPGGGITEKSKPRTDWGHVGDLGHYRSQLEQLRDQVHQRGEYAPENRAPSSVHVGRVHEEVQQLVEENDIADIRQRMMAANKVHQLGVQHKDKDMQAAAKTKLQQLAKAHAQLMAGRSNEELDPHFAVVLEEVNALVAEIEEQEPTLDEKFVLGVGEELAVEIMEALEAGDDEVKELITALIQDERWDDLVDVFTAKDQE